MPYILPDLNFNYDALEPHIDAKTMKLHYMKHHLNYLNRLNEAVKHNGLDDKSIDELFDNVSEYPDSIRNNGGGFYNHSLFWSILTPYSNGIRSVELSDAINKYFGTLENLKEELSTVALNQFGSGWAWLVKKENNELLVYSTANQDNPLMDVSPIRGKPLLCIDVWEHAYYIKYRNARADYIQAFWNVVNWDYVAELFNH